MNKIEKIEKFVSDMRFDIADRKATAHDKEFQRLVRIDTYLSSIQWYIQKVKDEEE